MDTLTVAERSRRMSLVRGKDTKAEMVVRRLIHRMGYRYRLHDRDLPGNPDMVFAGQRKVIFVHGCFWHRHGGCKLTRWPKSKLDFWRPKLEQNHERDKVNKRKLVRLGWKVLVVWECQLNKVGALTARLSEFLERQ
ncbi:MAG: very short patch repair endonuclease [Bryobacteraceae bacterium]